MKKNKNQVGKHFVCAQERVSSAQAEKNGAIYSTFLLNALSHSDARYVRSLTKMGGALASLFRFYVLPRGVVHSRSAAFEICSVLRAICMYTHTHNCSSVEHEALDVASVIGFLVNAALKKRWFYVFGCAVASLRTHIQPFFNNGKWAWFRLLHYIQQPN